MQAPANKVDATNGVRAKISAMKKLAASRKFGETRRALHRVRRRRPSDIMLSILRKQSQQLEKELLEVRQQLNKQKDEHEAAIAEKDAAIAALLAEKEEQQLAPNFCRACARSTTAVEEEWQQVEAPPEPQISTDELCGALDELKKKLRSTESKLTMEELERSLAELRVVTESSRVRRELTRTIEGQRTAAKAAADKAAKELEEAQREARKVARDLASSAVEVTELRAGNARRDEQISFLMQVHDASQECEWVPVGAGGAAAPPPAQWECNVCTLVNKAANTQCEVCGAPRGA